MIRPMRVPTFWLLILAAIGLIVASCGDGAGEVPAPAPSPTATPTAESLAQSVPTVIPTREPSATPTPTSTPSPTATATPSPTPTATPTSTPVPVLQRSLLLKRTSVVVGKHPVALVFDGTNVWVANTFDDSLMKLSPDGSVAGTFPVGKGPAALAFDGEHLWVANTGLELTTEEPPPGTVSKVTLTGEAVDEFPVGRWPVALAFDGQWLWVANLVDKTVMKLALNGSLVGKIELDLRPRALAVVGDDLWVLTDEEGASNGAITVLSSSLEVLATYTTGPIPQSILFDGESVWVANLGDSTVTRMALDGTVLATIEVEEGGLLALGFDGETIWGPPPFYGLAFGVALAWDGQAMWAAQPAWPDVFSGTTMPGAVSRLEVRDAPIPMLPLQSEAEELASPEADLAQYVLAQDQVQQIPGCAGWTDLAGYDLTEFLFEDPAISALFEGLEGQNSLEASGCGPSEGAVKVDATQVVFQFTSQEGATRFMERLRVPAYPFLAISAPQSLTQDFEAWFQELDPQSFGPGSFAVETSAALSAPLGELGGLKFHGWVFHGWVRYGNLVSLVLVLAGVDLHGDEESIKELLATRSGPFYTMEQFKTLLRAAYLGLKEGATRRPVEELPEPTPEAFPEAVVVEVVEPTATLTHTPTPTPLPTPTQHQRLRPRPRRCPTNLPDCQRLRSDM